MEPVPATPALALAHVAKRFGDTVALRDASLVVRPGTVHALLGENGAGKSTLVNVAFGLVTPDAGEVRVDGVPRAFASPADAIGAGLGMVHQHFRLVAAMTVAENVALGRRGRFDRRGVAGEIARVGDATGLRVDPDATVGALGVAAQQRVEIVKALVRGARVLVLDEPTAVLAPDEADDLLAWVRRWATAPGEAGQGDASGRAVVLITHRLREARQHADDVTVLRRGATALAAPAATLDERALVAAMLGPAEGGDDDGEGGARGDARARGGGPPHSNDAAGSGVAQHPARAGDIESPRGGPHADDPAAARAERHRTAAGGIDAARPAAPAVADPDRPPILRLAAAGYRDERGVVRLHPTTLDVRAGEILGVAAVEGAGHHELLRLLAGRLRPTAGHAVVPARVGFVPEDRHRDALLLAASVTDNLLLRDAGRRRGLLRPGRAAARAARLVAEHDVRGAAPRTSAGALSGGNQQKLVLARELWDDPPAVVAESPTRGLDVRAAAAVLARLREARDRGAAVVLFLPDLDELLAIADRVVAVHAGHVHAAPGTRDAIGRLMVGAA